jgi:general secretion pathway protein C
MKARLVAFLVWGLVAASAVFWLLRLVARSPSAPAHTLAVASSTVPRGDLARVLGAPPVVKSDKVVPISPALASRFKLLGVAAPREHGDREGLALIAVDGKPARGYRVGAPVDGEIVLLSVHPRGAALGERGATPQVQLELPPLPQPATGRPGTISPLPTSTVMPAGPSIGTMPTTVPPPAGAGQAAEAPTSEAGAAPGAPNAPATAR